MGIREMPPVELKAHCHRDANKRWSGNDLHDIHARMRLGRKCGSDEKQAERECDDEQGNHLSPARAVPRASP